MWSFVQVAEKILVQMGQYFQVKGAAPADAAVCLQGLDKRHSVLALMHNSFWL